MACGDIDNGFGLTFNWNLVENGEHRLRAFADGVQFADVTFTVATLGLGEFPQLETLASSVASVADFPSAGTRVRVQWQGRQQNFIVEGVLQPGEEETMCGTRRGIVTNSAGQEAELECKNPCTRLGGTQFCRLVPIQIPPPEQSVFARKQDEAFLFCAEDLSFEQMEGVFTVGDFQVLDTRGEMIGCREVLPGEELAIAITVEPMVALSFKEPVRTLFNQSEVFEFGDVCGDGDLAPSEACEGVNLGGASCLSEGFDGGTLSCNADCALNTSGCFGNPLNINFVYWASGTLELPPCSAQKYILRAIRSSAIAPGCELSDGMSVSTLFPSRLARRTIAAAVLVQYILPASASRASPPTVSVTVVAPGIGGASSPVIST